MADEVGFMFPSEDGEWTCRIAFDRDSWDFVLGVEVGMVFAEVQMIAEGMMAGYSRPVHAKNAEMVMRICEARCVDFSACPTDDDEWLSLHLGDDVGQCDRDPE